jgi:hypothetical protein
MGLLTYPVIRQKFEFNRDNNLQDGFVTCDKFVKYWQVTDEKVSLPSMAWIVCREGMEKLPPYMSSSCKYIE